MSRPRKAALRLATGHFGELPPRAEGAAGAASGQRLPAEAGDAGGGAKKGVYFTYMSLCKQRF
jgi:hypothetical protein